MSRKSTGSTPGSLAAGTDMRIWPRSQRPAEPAAAERHAPQWPSLPAVQRVLTPIAPVADREGFVSSLAAHTDPSFLAPLAHLVDPDGPSGRITGLIAPAPSAPAAAPPPRAATGVVQRWPNRWFGGPVISRSVSTDSADATAARSVPVDTITFDDPAPSDPAPSDPGPEPGHVHHFAQPPTPAGSGPAATVQGTRPCSRTRLRARAARRLDPRRHRHRHCRNAGSPSSATIRRYSGRC